MNAGIAQPLSGTPQAPQAPYAPAPTQQIPVVPTQQIPPQQFQQPQYQQPPAPQQQQQPPQPGYPGLPTYPPATPPGDMSRAPGQFQQQPAQQQAPTNPYDSVYQQIATNTGTTVERVRELFRDDPQQFGTIFGRMFQQLRQPQQQQQAPAPAPVAPVQQQGNQLPEVPSYAMQYMKRNETSNMWEATIPEAQQWAYAQNLKELADRDRLTNLIKNPASLLEDSAVKQMISNQVKEQVQQQQEVMQTMAVREEYKAKLLPFLYERNPQTGQELLDFNGKKIASPFGIAFNRYAQELYDSGVKESDRLYQYAITMAERDTGVSTQPQQQQYQQPAPQFNPLGLNQPQLPYQPQPDQSGMYPVTRLPMQPQPMHQVMRQQMAAASAFPGAAPPRAPQPLRGMSIKQAAQTALQGAPDGMGMEYYWQMLFGNKQR